MQAQVEQCLSETDRQDLADPLLCAEYAQEIHTNMKAEEL